METVARVGRRAFSTAVAQKAEQASDSFLARILGTHKRVSTPLNENFPAQIFPKINLPTSTPPTEVTTLANGVRIASENTPGAGCNIGIFVDAGSIYEGPGSHGISHVMQHMGFKATANRSSFRVIRELEVIGANVAATATREQMSYTVDCLKVHAPEAVELLADAVLNARMEDYEVEENKGKVAADLKKLGENPTGALLEAAHAVAFTGGLANPLVPTQSQLDRLTGSLCRQYKAELYTGPRIVVAASGVDHQELLTVAEPLLKLAPQGAADSVPSAYQGGELRLGGDGGESHAFVGFEAPGGWSDVKSSMTQHVLSALMGGGGAFSAGGPGKGMYSRLYTRVLNRFHYVSRCEFVHMAYNKTGLVGVLVSGDSAHAADLPLIAADEIAAAAAQLTKEEVDRAKAAAASNIKMFLESRAVITEDMGRSILSPWGRRLQLAEALDVIQKCTPESLQAELAKFAKTPLTLAVSGNVAAMPKIGTIQKKFA